MAVSMAGSALAVVLSVCLFACLISLSQAFLAPALHCRFANLRSERTLRPSVWSPRHHTHRHALLRLKGENGGEGKKKKEELPDPYDAPLSPTYKNFLVRFRPPKMERKQLAALGASAMLSYGMVSNVNMGICMMMAWVTFGKSTGLSPLDAGQWPKFLAVYGGFWLAANFLRPFRIAIAVAVSPAFDKLVEFWQKAFRISKAKAFGVTVFVVNVLGNLTFLFGGIVVSTALFRVPLLPTTGKFSAKPPGIVRAKNPPPEKVVKKMMPSALVRLDQLLMPPSHRDYFATAALQPSSPWAFSPAGMTINRDVAAAVLKAQRKAAIQAKPTQPVRTSAGARGGHGKPDSKPYARGGAARSDKIAEDGEADAAE